MAIKKQVVRSPDGGISVQYLDADTGKQVLGYNPANYASGGTAESNYAPQAYYGDATANQMNEVLEQSDIEAGREIKPKEGNGGNAESFSGYGPDKGRNESNNFGYQKDNLAIDAMGMLPGIAGVPGKVAKGVQNLSNVSAIDAAKKSTGIAGLKSSTSGQKAKGIVGGTHKGKVGDIKVGEKNYSIGLEATDEQGRTTITAKEARLRDQLSPLGAKVSTPEEADAAKKAAADAGIKGDSKLPGAIGKVADLGQSVADKIFGPDKIGTKLATPTPRETNPIDAPPSPSATTPTKLGLARNPYDAQPEAPETHPETVEATPSVEATVDNPLGVDKANTIAEKSKDALSTDTVNKGYGSAAAAPNSAIGGLNDEFGGRLQALSENVSKLGLGTVGVFSGKRTPEHQAQLVSNDMHKWGFSPDQVKSFNADVASLGAVEAGNKWNGALKASGMTAKVAAPGRSLHQKGTAVDMSWTDPVTGKTVSIKNAPQAVKDALGVEAEKIGLARPVAGEPWHVEPVTARKPNEETFGIQAVPESMAPTPTARPDPTAQQIAGTPAPTGITSLGGYQNSAVPAGPMSPSSMQAAGLGAQYSPQDKAAMATTLAGELSPSQLKGLEDQDPDALAEAASVLGTMDNRAMSNTFSNKPNPATSAVTSPAQYSSLAPSKLSNTLNNANVYGPAVEAAVDAYSSGAIQNTTPNATHMVNKDVANPGWGANVNDKVGDHTFGTPDASFKDTSQAYGLGVGPVSGVGISSPSGTMATPSGTYGSSLNPSGFGSVDNMGMGMVDPSSAPNAGLGTSIGGVSLGGWGGPMGGVNKTADTGTQASAASAADSTANAASADAGDTDGSDGSAGGNSGGSAGNALGGNPGAGAYGGGTGLGASGSTTGNQGTDNDNDHSGQGFGR